MFAQVVVLTYQSPEIDSYTYEVPKNLEKEIKPGQLVQVPFGKRNPIGIVLSTSQEISKFKFQISNLRKLSAVIFNQAILLPYQIKLLKWLAFYYHAPMVNCLEAMLPEIPSKSLMVNGSSGDKINPINDKQSTINQTLVLVPTINRIPEALAQFRQAKNYILYHAEQKGAGRFATWLKILSGNVDFIFGSRSAIFTPCPKLSKIIIFDEHDGAYKDNRSPYFDTLTVAEKLMQITGAKIQIIDSSPKITTYFSHKNDIQIPRSKIQTTIVSMIEERNKNNRTPISDLLSSLIIKTAKQKGKVLLFLNKKRESGQIYCKVCRFHEFAPNPPQVCPNCQSRDFYFNSLNIWSLAENIKQIVPKANINLIAEGTHHQPSNHPTIQLPASQAKRGESTIYIATASVFYRLSAQKYDLVAHILTDATLNIADFNSSEKTFAQITALKNLAAKNGRLILQTYNPGHPVIKNAAQGNYLFYFAQNLKERKALNFPPFALLVKLTIKGKDKETVEKKAEKLLQDLKSLPTALQPLTTTILGPYESIFSAKVPSYNIILKHKLNTYSLIEREKARQNLETYLGKVPRGWQIIVEPEGIN